jgi:hypothetical protein
MTKALSYQDRSCKTRGWASIRASNYGYKRGNVYTPNGIVYVYAAGNETRLLILHGGKEHRRYFNGYLSDRGIVTKAKRFAKEIVDGS